MARPSPQLTSAQHVTLLNLVQVLNSEQSSGVGWKTVFASLFLMLVPIDCYLLLSEKWQLEAPLLGQFTGDADIRVAITAILFVQIAALWFGIVLVRDSTLHRQLESSFSSVITFGLSFAKHTASLRYSHYILMAALAGLFYWFALAIPRIDANVAVVTRVVDQSMALGLPLIAAWLLTLLAFRAIQDRLIRIGLVLPALFLVLLSTLSNTNGAAAPGIPAGHMIWFRIVELSIAWAAILSLVYTVITDPAHSGLVIVTGENAATAELEIRHVPFGVGGAGRAVSRYLQFQLGSAHLLAFTREYNSPDCRVINATDTHVTVPVHNQELIIWNVTRLLAIMHRQIRVTDSRDLFALQIQVGSLATTLLSQASKNDKTIPHALLIATSQVVLSNPDLQGLLSRAAGETIESHVQGSQSTIDRAFAQLRELPVFMETPLASVLSRSSDELDAWIDQYTGYQTSAQKRLKAISEAQNNLRICRDSASQWRQHGAPVQSVEKGGARPLHIVWYDNIIKEIENELDKSGTHISDQYRLDAGLLIQALGLRFNDVKITTSARFHKLESDLEAARVELATQLEKYHALYEGAIQRRTAAVLSTNTAREQMTHEKEKLLMQAILSTPGALTAKTLPDLIGALQRVGLNVGPNDIGRADLRQPRTEAPSIPSAPSIDSQPQRDPNSTPETDSPT